MSIEYRPDLSVVVPSVNGWGDLRGVLEALYAQRGGVALEIVVVERVGEALREPLRKQFPQVIVIPVTPNVTIPQMRAMAFEAAHADVIGVIEDHVIVPPDWARRMLAAHAAGALVVGGAVDNAATLKLVDWAAFLCEYSHCLTPPPSGPAPWLTGNNVTYRKSLLQRFDAILRLGRWEDSLHNAFKDAGIALVSKPEICVGHKKHYSVGEYTSQRFLYSRAYAALRVQDAPWSRRFLYGCAAFALPPLIYWRVVSQVLRSGRYRAELLRSLPLLGLFACSWALGEAAGYWRGDGGALARVC